MSENSTNQEIDLLKVADGFSKKLSQLTTKAVNFIKFIKRNIIYILALFIIGAVLGYFYDKNNKSYYTEIIVSPNFNTVDFLNNQIDVVNSRIELQDEKFYAQVGISKQTKIGKVEVKPITDIYRIIDNNELYLDLFKTMTENNDASKIIEDYATSKNFPLHQITIHSGEVLDQKVLDNIMKFINTSDYYNKSRVEIAENLKDKLANNNTSIDQINAILNQVGSSRNVNATVFYNDNKELNELINNKTKLIQENHELKVHLKNLDYIVTPINYATNINNKSGLNNKMKLVFPILFVGGFFVFAFIRRYF
ncbi:MAG: hypothetical protein KIG88_04430 [Weeksellaceae bacterium]|nr:hypothetical protein [Weeksellaceae bacterium]